MVSSKELDTPLLIGTGAVRGASVAERQDATDRLDRMLMLSLERALEIGVDVRVAGGRTGFDESAAGLQDLRELAGGEEVVQPDCLRRWKILGAGTDSIDGRKRCRCRIERLDEGCSTAKDGVDGGCGAFGSQDALTGEVGLFPLL